MFILKLIISILCWVVCNKICQNIEFDNSATDYDKFEAYSTVWCATFLVVFIILSLF